jgi:hypothetical protein
MDSGLKTPTQGIGGLGEPARIVYLETVELLLAGILEPGSIVTADVLQAHLGARSGQSMATARLALVVDGWLAPASGARRPPVVPGAPDRSLRMRLRRFMPVLAPGASLLAATEALEVSASGSVYDTFAELVACGLAVQRPSESGGQRWHYVVASDAGTRVIHQKQLVERVIAHIRAPSLLPGDAITHQLLAHDRVDVAYAIAELLRQGLVTVVDGEPPVVAPGAAWLLARADAGREQLAALARH